MRSESAPQYLLEAKISSYKLYDKSLLSLIPKNGLLSDEVRIYLIMLARQTHVCFYLGNISIFLFTVEGIQLGNSC